MPVATKSRRRPHLPMADRNYQNERRFDHATHLDFGVKPFIAFICHRCRRGLHDRAGNPRWEIDGLSCNFVCPGGCPGGEGGS